MNRPDPIPFNTPLNREPRTRHNNRVPGNQREFSDITGAIIITIIVLALIIMAVCKKREVNDKKSCKSKIEKRYSVKKKRKRANYQSRSRNTTNRNTICGYKIQPSKKKYTKRDLMNGVATGMMVFSAAKGK